MSDARDDAPTPAASPPALGYGVGGTAGWSAETKAVIVAAAVVSLLSLGTWGGSLWQYLQPRAFRGSSLMLGKPLSLDFLRFVLVAVMHVTVIAGAMVAPANPRLARRLLLTGALGVVGLAVYQFAAFSIFQAGLMRPRVGPDQLFWLADDGARLVGMHLVHGLLVMILARPGAGAGAGAAGWRHETPVIVAAAAVNAAVIMADEAALMWVFLQPSLFDTIGVGSRTTQGWVLLALRTVLHLATVAGAAAALSGRAPAAGRRLLLGAAVALLALGLYGYVRFALSPLPPGMPRYQGAEWVRNTYNRAAHLLTPAMIHALVIFALTRPHARAEALKVDG